jgi:hypothetical protein
MQKSAGNLMLLSVFRCDMCGLKDKFSSRFIVFVKYKISSNYPGQLKNTIFDGIIL